MAAAPPVVVLGLRPHTYWTAIVALGGSMRAPQVLERRRAVFATGSERNCFHHAAEGPLEAAPILIMTTYSAVLANAAAALSTLLADLQGAGLAVRTAVVSAPTSKHPVRLPDILASHTYIHAAEGNFYRDIVAGACESVGLQVERTAERDMPQRVRDRLAIDQPTLDARLKTLGAPLGPPWNQDYRLATLAAWPHLP
jgi:hypothetical protein